MQKRPRRRETGQKQGVGEAAGSWSRSEGYLSGSEGYLSGRIPGEKEQKAAGPCPGGEGMSSGQKRVGAAGAPGPGCALERQSLQCAGSSGEREVSSVLLPFPFPVSFPFLFFSLSPPFLPFLFFSIPPPFFLNFCLPFFLFLIFFHPPSREETPRHRHGEPRV